MSETTLAVAVEADLPGLLERLQAAKGPDREVDCLIALALDGYYTEPERYEGGGLRYCYTATDGTPIVPGQSATMLVREYTASLDAALALVERTLPVVGGFVDRSPPSSGWKISLYRGMTPTGAPHASWHAMIRPHAGPEVDHVAPTTALALLAALLSALLNQVPSHG